MFFDLSSSTVSLSSSLTIMAKQDQYDICVTRVSCKFAQVGWCRYGFVTDIDIMMSGRSYLARVIATRL